MFPCPHRIRRFLHKRQGSKTFGNLYFSTTDPNLYIKVADLDRKAENELFARLKVVPVPERMAADMAASVKKIF